MNHGFSFALPTEWVIFWGSDDWAANNFVLSHIFEFLNSSNNDNCDLLVLTGRYVNLHSGFFTRKSSFLPKSFLNSTEFRHSLFWGHIPPHQATLFGPNIHSHVSYSNSFKLSADLDLFLRLSLVNDIKVKTFDVELVHMSEGGVSGIQTRKRLVEVFSAYFNSFGLLWFIPFISRYIRRFLLLL